MGLQADLFPDPSHIPDDKLREYFDNYRKLATEARIIVCDMIAIVGNLPAEQERVRLHKMVARVHEILRDAERGVRPNTRHVPSFAKMFGLTNE